MKLSFSASAWIGASLFLAVALAIASAHFWVPHNPNEQYRHAIQSEDGTPVGPTSEFWLGADPLGRDELSRLAVGGQISLRVAVIATLVAIVLGLGVGLVSGYAGGAIDQAMMRFVDVLLSVPFLLIAIALHRAVQSKHLEVGTSFSLDILLGCLSWTTLARVVRSKVQGLASSEFVMAARVLGYSHLRILSQHILLNVLGTVFAMASLIAANVILMESAMSFLGLGIPPPQASWGSMLREGQTLLTHTPRLVILPGLMIVGTVLSLTLISERIRDAWDPKSG